jgi:cell division control protein 6
VDELDVLVSKAQWVLVELFMLSSLPGARCVLVGAANTMNLTESVLPRGMRGREPVLVPFHAYTVAQVNRLLRARLQALPWLVFDDTALDLCARKVAAATGDFRSALQAARSALSAARQEAAQATDEGQPAGNRVCMNHMADALSQVFKSPVVDTVRDLPSDEKMVLCAFVLLLRSSGLSEVSHGELSDHYLELCRQQSVKSTLNKLQFDSACTALVTYSIITCEGSTRRDSERKRRISLAASVEDVVFALQSNQVRSSWLQEGQRRLTCAPPAAVLRADAWLIA